MKYAHFQQVKSLTLSVMYHFYRQNAEPILHLLHPDITWVYDKDGQCRTGRHAVSEILSERRFPFPVSASSTSCQMLHQDSESCIVFFTYTCAKHHNHRVTFIWKSEGDKLLILHIHASLSLSEPAAVAQLSFSGRAATLGPILSFTGCHKEQYYLTPNEILCVEADNNYSYLCCEKQDIHVRHPFSLMQELLPDYFLKIHRSFLVNQHYIVMLKQFTVELTNGVELPVSEKNYNWLKQYLDKLCKSSDSAYPIFYSS